jgi:ATP/ADP translocase
MAMSPAVVLAVLAAALMILQQVLAKAARDTLFLSTFAATALPSAMIAAALVSLPAVLGGASLMARFGPRRFLPPFLVVNGVAFVLEWAALPVAPQAIAVLTYVHVASFGGLSISGFWSVVNERFDPHAARRAFGVIALGSAVGGLLGGILAERMTAWLGVRAMLLALGPTNVLGALAIAGVGAPLAQPPSPETRRSGLATLARSPYLQALAFLVVVVAIGGATLDYSFKSAAAAQYPEPARLGRLFALYYTAVSVVTVLLQGTLARYTLDRLGLGNTLAVLPAALLVGGTLSLSLGGVWSIVILRGAAAALANSFFRSGYEPLYTPLPNQAKRATKAIIDVAADRMGDAIGSGAILLLLALAPFHTSTGALIIAMAASAVTLWLVIRLQSAYVAELGTSLRTGMISLSPREIADATTRLTLSQTQGALDRQAILREVEALRRGIAATPPMAKGAAELGSGDEERIRRALAAGPLDRRLVSLVVPLLDYDDLADSVAELLSEIAPAIVGQLSDALLDPTLSEKARRRIPALLAKASHPRAVRALCEGLVDPNFDLKERCARALLALRRGAPALGPRESIILPVVLRELEQARSPNVVSRGEHGDQPPPAIGVRPDDRLLRFIFTLLALVLDTEAFELALRALDGTDEKLRGTALEYLENVIPGEVRSLLWPHLRDHRPEPTRPKRSSDELTEELKRSLSGA